MRIIEQKIVGKHSQEDCEDGIVVTDDFVAVIDGSTSKTKNRLNPEMKNGRYCMMLISDYIRTMPADISLNDFCDGITAKIHALYKNDTQHEDSEKFYLDHPEERLCASAVIYSKAKDEVWMIGDCQCIVGGKLYTNDKPYEARIANKRAAIFNEQLALHADMVKDGHIVHDYARDQVISELVEAMRKGENKTYAVIDGESLPLSPFRGGGKSNIPQNHQDDCTINSDKKLLGVKVIPVYSKTNKENKEQLIPPPSEGARERPAREKLEVVLASDGYPFLCSTLEKSEKKLAKQLANDPYNIKDFKATKGLMVGNKSFDDRAYIRFSTAETQRYFITISFDGTAYHGWQIQPNGMSVQEKLQNCLSKILRHKVDVVGAGRTDAGVHARTMVAHMDEDKGLDCKQLKYRLNQILPKDISCREVEPVSMDLHARFSAKKRTYRYFIHTTKDPFLRHYSVETHYNLDFDKMNEAAAYLLTVKDFKAFCKAGADNKTTFCKVTTAHWVQTGDNEWYFEIAADRFLRNMVRAVVGTLFDVGRHRISIEEFKHIVDNGTRSDSGESMPANGLFLWEIEY